METKEEKNQKQIVTRDREDEKQIRSREGKKEKKIERFRERRGRVSLIEVRLSP